MRLDYEKYRHHLSEHNFTRQQENEIMSLMWQSMGAAAEKAWGISPIDNIEQEVNEFTLREQNTSLDSKYVSIKQEFEMTSLTTPSERIH